jgi:hypothetical protein
MPTRPNPSARMETDLVSCFIRNLLDLRRRNAHNDCNEPQSFTVLFDISVSIILRRSSNSCGVFTAALQFLWSHWIEQRGVFLMKTPLSGCGSGLHQLENRYGSSDVAFTSTPASNNRLPGTPDPTPTTRTCRWGPRKGKRHLTASVPLYTYWRAAVRHAGIAMR